MNKLLTADIIRIFKGKSFYYGLFFSTLLAMFFVFINKSSNDFIGIPDSSALMILPFFTGAVIALKISSEFTSGVIRNKLIMGHSRIKIIFSWSICALIITLLFYIFFEAGTFSFAYLLSYNLSHLETKLVIKNLLLLGILLLSNVFFIILICVIYEDTKSIVLMFLFEYALLFISSMGGELFSDNKTAQLLLRFFPLGQLTVLSVTKAPDRPWLTIICALSTSIIMLVTTLAYFRKHDMK